MKRVLLVFCLISATVLAASGQDKKAEREAAAAAAFEKALAAVEAKDFVIIVDSYDSGDGNFVTNTDNANFLSYESEFIFLQGQMIAGNGYTNKLNIISYDQSTDKKGNVKLLMQVRGFYITAKIQISVKKSAGSYADVIITPTKGDTKRFSGDIVPRAESKYFKRPGEI
jgi:hypothetical protein